MKKTISIILILVLCFSFVSILTACNNTPVTPPPDDGGNDDPPKLKALAKPFVSVDENGIASWNTVQNAVKYIYKINNGTEMTTKTTAVQLNENDTICVKAVGDGKTYGESVYSAVATYIKTTVDPDPKPDDPDPTPVLKKLSTPFVLLDEQGVATWGEVSNAVKYVIKINNGEETDNTARRVQLADGDSLIVKAVGDGETYGESAYCSPVVYTKPIEVDGWYVLNEKTIEGIDVTNNYVCNTIKLERGEAVWREVDINGARENIGTYEFSANSNTLRIVIGSTTYVFNVGKKGAEITFDGTVNRKSIRCVFDKNNEYAPSADIGTVEFSQELFGDDITKNFYNYCPTVMMEGRRTMHIWYCSNQISGNVTDYVAYRKGTLHDDGKWTFTDKAFVLGPGEAGSWDGRHVCDPSVVKGVFRYNGETYNYMMAYLGCMTSDNTKNEVGIAFAKNPQGPYVKVDEVNPICNFYEDYGLSRTESSSDNQYRAWGYGQPSLVSVDKAGKVLFFFTNGNANGTGCTAMYLDMSDVNNIRQISKMNILSNGITNANSASDCINNADFAYDPELGRLYCIKEDFPYTGSETNWITSSNTIFYLQLDKNSDNVFAPLFDPSSTRTWVKVGALTESLTGYKRNHNCGIVTDEYGWLLSGAQLPVVYTMSDLASEHSGWGGGGQWPALHTYRLHGIVFDLI